MTFRALLETTTVLMLVAVGVATWIGACQP
jgi:hypothetical protein